MDLLAIRERSFLILGTGAEDFWQGYETILYFRAGRNILRAILMGYKIILLEKNFDEVINQRLKKKFRDIWKRKSSGTTWYRSVHISIFYGKKPKNFWMGY